jgi:hypothetical protein
MMKSMLVAAMTIGLAIGVAGSASADVFVLNNDLGGDGFVNTVPGGFDLFGGDNGVAHNNTTYLAVAGVNETLVFDWSYITHDVNGSAFDPAGFVLNGVFTQLSTNNTNGQPNQINSNGVLTLVVLAGQNYGFYVNTTDGILGRGEIDVTTAGVPEPATWAMMLLGFVGLGMTYGRTSRKSAIA